MILFLVVLAQKYIIKLRFPTIVPISFMAQGKGPKKVLTAPPLRTIHVWQVVAVELLPE